MSRSLDVCCFLPSPDKGPMWLKGGLTGTVGTSIRRSTIFQRTSIMERFNVSDKRKSIVSSRGGSQVYGNRKSSQGSRSKRKSTVVVTVEPASPTTQQKKRAKRTSVVQFSGSDAAELIKEEA